MCISLVLCGIGIDMSAYPNPEENTNFVARGASQQLMLLGCTRVYSPKLLSTPLTSVSFAPPRTFINTNAKQMKKPRILRCILVWVLLLLASCRSADSPTPQIKAVDHQPAGAWSSPQRTLTEVRSIAQAYLTSLGNGARSLEKDGHYQVIALSTTKRQSLRSMEGKSAYRLVDTMLYVVNVGREEGALLIAGDKRIPAVVGFIPRGHISLEPDSLHPGLKMVLDRLPGYYDRSLRSIVRKSPYTEETAECRFRPDPRAPGRSYFYYDDHDDDWELADTARWGKCDVDFPHGYKIRWWWKSCYWKGFTGDQVTPLCRVTWHQGSPYNDRAKQIYDRKAPAGCVAVSVAQLLSVYKYPSSLKDVSLDWELLTQKRTASLYTASDRTRYDHQVSILLRTIGDGLDNDWKLSGTGADIYAIPRVLRSLGYTHPSSVTDFDEAKVVTSLQKGYPVLFGGMRGEYGHAWLCDGFRTSVYRYEEGHTKECSDDKTEICGERVIDHVREWRIVMLHFNWGWGLDPQQNEYDGDGYFAAGLFSKEIDNKYSEDIKVLLDIHP